MHSVPMPSRAEQQRYWDAVDRRRTPSHPVVRAFSEPIVRNLSSKIGTGHRLLEIGAGNGFLSQPLAQFFDLTVVDFSRNMLELNPLPDERKVEAYAESLPFEAGSFDVAFCANLLHHLPDPRVAVKEMRRVARNYVVLLEPNARNPLMCAFNVLKKEERGAIKFTLRYLRDLGTSSGLILEHAASQGVIVPNKTPTAAIRLLRRFERFERMLGFYNLAVFAVPHDDFG